MVTSFLGGFQFTRRNSEIFPIVSLHFVNSVKLVMIELALQILLVALSAGTSQPTATDVLKAAKNAVIGTQSVTYVVIRDSVDSSGNKSKGRYENFDCEVALRLSCRTQARRWVALGDFSLRWEDNKYDQ
jgi:hypothetical protein